MSATIMAPFWPDNRHWLADPWSSRDGAVVTHKYSDFETVPHIHDNFQAGRLASGAKLDWSRQTVFIAGRGPSRDAALPYLSKRKPNPAIWLNHAWVGANVGENDWCMCIESQAVCHFDTQNAHRIGLITYPGIDPDIFNLPWREVVGVTHWPRSPLNDHMRRLWPHLPSVNEALGQIVGAVHLAALNGAERCVFVGCDFEFDDVYRKVAMATALQCYYAIKHTSMECINASGSDVLNVDCAGDRMSWMGRATLDEVFA